jgi:hypothetical protein
MKIGDKIELEERVFNVFRNYVGVITDISGATIKLRTCVNDYTFDLNETIDNLPKYQIFKIA